MVGDIANREFSDATSEDLSAPLLQSPWPGIYFDQNGDGKATALDALRVINRLQEIVESGGEGERFVNRLRQQVPLVPATTSDLRSLELVHAIAAVDSGIKVSEFSTQQQTLGTEPSKQSSGQPKQDDSTWTARVDQLLQDQWEGIDLDADRMHNG